MGLAPQAFLGPEAADAWAVFWWTARRIDDAAEQGAPAADWRNAVNSLGVAGDLEAALGALDPTSRGHLVAAFDAAWAALGRRHSWRRPPALDEYLHASGVMAGLPIRWFWHLADPSLGPEQTAGPAELLGASVQVGDDVRDRAEDLQRGLATRAAEEPEEEEQWLEFRLALCAWFLAAALSSWPPLAPDRAGDALGLAVLWHGAIASGQVRPTTEPLDLGVPDVSGSRGWFAALRARAAPARKDPEAVKAILRQDLVRRASGLSPVVRSVCASVERRFRARVDPPSVSTRRSAGGG